MSSRNSGNMNSKLSKALKKSAQAGIQQHKVLMDRLVSTKQPLTNGQIKEFYMSNLQEIMSAFDSTFEIMQVSANPKLTKEIQATKTKMALEIQNKLGTFLTKYDNSIEAVAKQIKDMTIATDTDYCNRLDRFNLEEMTVEQVKSEGEKLKAESIKNFELLVRHIKLSKDFLKMELISNLDEKLEEIIEQAELKGISPKNQQSPKIVVVEPTIEEIQKDDQLIQNESIEVQKIDSGLDAWKDSIEQLLQSQQKVLQEQNVRFGMQFHALLNRIESIEMSNKELLTNNANQLRSLEEIVDTSVTEIKGSLAEIKANVEAAEKATTKNFGNLQGMIQQIIPGHQFKITNGCDNESNVTDDFQKSQDFKRTEGHKATKTGSNGTEGFQNHTDNSGPKMAMSADNGFTNSQTANKKENRTKIIVSSLNIAKTATDNENKYSGQVLGTVPAMKSQGGSRAQRSTRPSTLSGRNITSTHNNLNMTGPRQSAAGKTPSEGWQALKQTKSQLELTRPKSKNLSLSLSNSSLNNRRKEDRNNDVYQTRKLSNQYVV